MFASFVLASLLVVGGLHDGSAPADQAARRSGANGKTPARTVEIVGTDDMKYSVTTITAKPGEQLRIVLRAAGEMRKLIMAHNVVVLQQGVDANAFNAAAAAERAANFIPPGREKEIVAATALAGAGETVEVTFTVPAKTGNYDYLCTFPGHFIAGMRGVLTVK
jgi:azurin